MSLTLVSLNNKYYMSSVPEIILISNYANYSMNKQLCIGRTPDLYSEKQRSRVRD